MAEAAADNYSNPSAAPSANDIRLVITASSLGTVFEWYDFFLWGTLTASGILQREFFPPGNAVLATLLAWATFAIGFAFRPLGAVVFGYLGDIWGRKYTFLITITLMGIATAGIGLVPGYAAIGAAAPTAIILFRIVQGMALGGEYGGAAIYVVEHAPPGRAGFLSSFIQASVVGGFILSLAVVLTTKLLMPAASWAEWGWRAPFLFSILLLAISLWMRLKLSESPVFLAMKAAGETAKNPFVESFTYPGNLRRLFVALFGISAGLTVVWYTAMFTTLSFLQGPMRVEETTAQLIVAAAAVAGVFVYLLAGRISDRIGRKRPIVWGHLATLILIFPIFWTIGSAANPSLERAARTAPVVVAGQACTYAVFAPKQTEACGVILDYLSKRGIPYSKASGAAVAVSVGGEPLADTSPAGLDAALEGAGYQVEKVVPSPGRLAVIFAALLVMMSLSAFSYAPVAALFAEMFPPRIRYSSMSIPYHIGAGYFGGFLPLISQYVVARTGDPYSGLWYAFAVTAMALVVTAVGLQEGAGAGLTGWRRKAGSDSGEAVNEAPHRLRLDAAALTANWRLLDAMSGAAACGAAIKADGYGLGASGVAERLAAAGCRNFFVATWAEAAALAPLGLPLAVLHGVRAEDVPLALTGIARPVLNSAAQVARWRGAGGGACDVMVDTGMNRLGVAVDEVAAGLLDGLAIDTLMSHLACADEDHPMNRRQRDLLAGLRERTAARRLSLSNSAGIALGRDYAFDLTRPGLALYGGVPRAELAAIRQVVFPQAQVIQRRRVRAGETVGYNATWTARQDTEVAIINLGYADGYFRGFSNRGMARFGNAELPVIGRVSMDLTALAVDAAPAIAEGDWVDIDFALPAAAAASGMSQYELLTGLGRRYERNWRG